jgi:hypothetical protein
MLRAGFAEVLVTGMLTRWMRVRARPIARGARPRGAGDAAEHLCDDVGGEVFRRESSARPQAHRNGGIHVAPRYMADRVCHRDDGETESQKAPMNSAPARFMMDMEASLRPITF